MARITGNSLHASLFFRGMVLFFWFQAMLRMVFQDQAGHIHNDADHEANMPPLSIDGQRTASALDIYRQMVDCRKFLGVRKIFA